MVALRPHGRCDLHRRVGLLARAGPDASRGPAVRRGAALPAPASVAHPAGLLGRSDPVGPHHRRVPATRARRRERSAGPLAVHGLLLQDAVGSANPNGAFWSIAVEWQIYFVFPLILLLGRRTSIGTAVSLTAVAVLLAHAAASFGGPLDKIDGLTPQFLALFALGVFAVWLGGDDRRRSCAPARRSWRWWRSAPSSCSRSSRVRSGWSPASSGWTSSSVIGVASLLALMHAGGVAPARRVLASRGSSVARAVLLQHLSDP